jgi:hypothetical protein
MRLGAIILAGRLIGAPWLLTGGKRKCNLERQGAGPAYAPLTGGVELMNKRISSVCFDVPVLE